MKDLGINLVAVDFDQTILDIHTHGAWAGTLEELKEHVRPEFIQLILEALESDLKVAIVTFSTQIHVVRGIIEFIVGPDEANHIPIRGGDRSWRYQGQGSRDGKQAHIASAVEELEQRGEIEITRKTTILIDDDARNVRYALKDGTRAIWFNPNKPHHLWRDLGKLQ